MSNSLGMFFSIVTLVFVFVEQTSAIPNTVLIDDKETAPLVLMKKTDNSLSLAIPETYDKENKKIGYAYDDSEEDFETACPIPTDEMTEEQKKWLEEETVSIQSDILRMGQTVGEKNMDCGVRLVPSIRKTGTKCSRSQQGEIYEVGYPISSPNTLDIEFLYLYKLCFSPSKGTIYSFHRIESPNLQLKTVYTKYVRLLYFPTKFDEELENKLKSEGEQGYYMHDFIGHDLPIYQWYRTTEFLPNYTPITFNDLLFEGMMKFDNFIRLFSKMTEQKLTFYTGTYEYPQSEPVKLFWKIIMDSEKRAVIMITQHTPNECENREGLCSNTGSYMLDKYYGHGCTYLCTVNDEILEALDLPPMEISNNLKLEIPKISSPEFIHITDFSGNISFLKVLREVDSLAYRAVLKGNADN